MVGARTPASRKLGVALITMMTVLGLSVGTAVATTWATTAGAKKPVPVVTVELGDTAGLGGPMTMTISPSSVPAGKVKFTATNSGTILHEMVVLKVKNGFDQLPVNVKTNKISESTNVGEVGNVPKGKTKSKTLKLKKGSYAIVCNIAKHYGLGMRAGLTVT